MTREERLEQYLKEKLDENESLKQKVEYLEHQLNQFQLKFEID